jgi:hypothetical protein
MTKLYSVNREDGFVWLAAMTVAGVWVWLHRQARIGHCFRPGQRAPDEPSK